MNTIKRYYVHILYIACFLATVAIAASTTYDVQQMNNLYSYDNWYTTVYSQANIDKTQDAVLLVPPCDIVGTGVSATCRESGKHPSLQQFDTYADYTLFVQCSRYGNKAACMELNNE